MPHFTWSDWSSENVAKLAQKLNEEEERHEEGEKGSYWVNERLRKPILSEWVPENPILSAWITRYQVNECLKTPIPSDWVPENPILSKRVPKKTNSEWTSAWKHRYWVKKCP